MNDDLKINVPSLKRNDTGDFVFLLQKLLKAKGITGQFSKPITVNGIFDINTRFAVQNYQATRRGYLVYSGQCDSQTWKCLLSSGDIRYDGCHVSFPELYFDEDDTFVAVVQSILLCDGYYSGEINYHYGEEMQEALRQFASDRGLNFKGYVDCVMWLDLIYQSGLRKDDED